MNLKRLAWLAVGPWLLVACGRLEAQGNPVPVLDLTEGEVTEQAFREALQPPGEPPLELLGTSRGISVATRPRPKCSFARQEKSRGISVSVRPPVKAAATKIFFAFNSAEILPESHLLLDNLGKALKSQPLSLCCFQIVGHTDDTGSDAFNDGLSLRRAEAVVRYLATRFGIEAGRLEPVGRGERQPMEGNSTEAGRSKNRRVEIENLGYAQADL